MHSDFKIGYIGIGSYLPPRVVSNDDLAQIVDTSDDWIQKMTGIRERRILDAGESLLDMAAQAAQKALDDAGLTAADLDDIRVAVNSWMQFPSLATQVQKVLGAKRASASDVAAGCAGFIYAVEDAHNRILTEKVKYGRDAISLVLGVDALSHIVDWQDRNTCVLFGDAAGAVVLGQVEAGGILATHTHAKGQYGELLYSDPLLENQVEPGEELRFSRKDHGPRAFLHMDGPGVYGLAIQTMTHDVRRVIEKYNATVDDPLSAEDIDYVYPHQANLRIIEKVAERLRVPLTKVYTEGIARYGNTTTASIPLGYCDEVDRPVSSNGRRFEVDVAFGAGFASGAMLREVA